MDIRESMEEMVVHANVCLKRWEVNSRENPGRRFRDQSDMRSMILSWLNRAFAKVYSSNGGWKWRDQKQIAKSLGKFMDFTIAFTSDDVTTIHISSITVMKDSLLGIKFPVLDYAELNRRASGKETYIHEYTSFESISFDDIEKIKFTL